MYGLSKQYFGKISIQNCENLKSSCKKSKKIRPFSPFFQNSSLIKQQPLRKVYFNLKSILLHFILFNCIIVSIITSLFSQRPRVRKSGQPSWLQDRVESSKPEPSLLHPDLEPESDPRPTRSRLPDRIKPVSGGHPFKSGRRCRTEYPDS